MLEDAVEKVAELLIFVQRQNDPSEGFFILRVVLLVLVDVLDALVLTLVITCDQVPEMGYPVDIFLVTVQASLHAAIAMR